TYFFSGSGAHLHPHSFPTRRSSDLFSRPWSTPFTAPLRARPSPSTPARRTPARPRRAGSERSQPARATFMAVGGGRLGAAQDRRSEEHTSELQSRGHLVCRLLLEKK